MDSTNRNVLRDLRWEQAIAYQWTSGGAGRRTDKEERPRRSSVSALLSALPQPSNCPTAAMTGPKESGRPATRSANSSASSRCPSAYNWPTIQGPACGFRNQSSLNWSVSTSARTAPSCQARR